MTWILAWELWDILEVDRYLCQTGACNRGHSKGEVQRLASYFWNNCYSDENRICRNGQGCSERNFTKEMTRSRIRWKSVVWSEPGRSYSVSGSCRNRANRYRPLFPRKHGHRKQEGWGKNLVFLWLTKVKCGVILTTPPPTSSPCVCHYPVLSQQQYLGSLSGASPTSEKGAAPTTWLSWKLEHHIQSSAPGYGPSPALLPRP
jgi:hypothetical protein